MKRVVAWNVPALEPGELTEIQAQFEMVTPLTPPTTPPTPATTNVTPSTSPQIPTAAGTTTALMPVSTPKFPILIGCDANEFQFSSIELIATSNDDNQVFAPNMKVHKIVRVLHQKV